MKAILKDGRVLDVVLGNCCGVVCTDGVTKYVYTLGIEIDQIVPDRIEKGSLLSKDIDWQQVTNQAAIGAMQVMLTSGVPTSLQYQYTKDSDNHKVIASEAVLYARALVEELKKDVNI